MKKVIATDRGYDNLVVREPGDVFDMPDDATGSWFKPVEEDGEPKAAKGKGATGKSLV